MSRGRNQSIKLAIRISLATFLLTSLLSTKAQNVNGSGRTSTSHLKINLLKPFIGFVNLGYEKTFRGGWGLQFFNEYMLRKRVIILDQYEHPVYVAELGVRKYLNSRQANPNGIYAGAHSGLTLPPNGSSQTRGWLAAVQFGYKNYLLRDRLFLELRAIGSYNTAIPETVLPGIELHAGWSL